MRHATSKLLTCSSKSLILQVCYVVDVMYCKCQLTHALAEKLHVTLLFLTLLFVIMTVMTAVSASFKHGNIAGDQEEMAAEKKLLRAEVASLKRQAAEQRMSLQIIQHDVHQVRSVLNRCRNEVNAQSCTDSAWF